MHPECSISKDRLSSGHQPVQMPCPACGRKGHVCPAQDSHFWTGCVPCQLCWVPRQQATVLETVTVAMPEKHHSTHTKIHSSPQTLKNMQISPREPHEHADLNMCSNKLGWTSESENQMKRKHLRVPRKKGFKRKCISRAPATKGHLGHPLPCSWIQATLA